MAPDVTVRSWAVLAVVVENLIKTLFALFDESSAELPEMQGYDLSNS